MCISRSMISCVYTLIFIPVGGDAQTNVAERLNLFDTTRDFPMQSHLTLEQILEVTFFGQRICQERRCGNG